MTENNNCFLCGLCELCVKIFITPRHKERNENISRFESFQCLFDAFCLANDIFSNNFDVFYIEIDSFLGKFDPFRIKFDVFRIDFDTFSIVGDALRVNFDTFSIKIDVLRTDFDVFTIAVDVFSIDLMRQSVVRLFKIDAENFEQSFAVAPRVSGFDAVVLLDKIFAHLRIGNRTGDDVDLDAEIF